MRKLASFPRTLLLFFLAAYLAAQPQSYTWQGLREGFPKPVVPAGNPMSDAKVDLGRHLFYDKRLSGNGQQSCGSCHRQELAFTDGRARAQGSTGELHPRSSMSLANVGYVPFLTWANGEMKDLERQALLPMFGLHPVELGTREPQLIEQISADPLYRRLFADAFPGQAAAVTRSTITQAIAAFERTLISTASLYDRYRYGGDPNAISEAAKRGEILFFSSEKAGCFQCHGGWNFAGAVQYEGLKTPPVRPDFRNTGVTATPDALIRPLRLTPQDKADLIAFLQSLTDRAFLRNPRFADPWSEKGK